jgi:hypothetical protein
MTYAMPRGALDLLEPALRGRRNAPACLLLATFIARFWSMPHRIILAFCLDRRELAAHPELGLSEYRIRGAIRTLEEIGFLDRQEMRGSRFQRTEAGLHRRPISFRFGADYRQEFLLANAKSRRIERRPLKRAAPNTDLSRKGELFGAGAGRAPCTAVAVQAELGLAGSQPMPMLSLEARQTRIVTGRRW